MGRAKGEGTWDTFERGGNSYHRFRIAINGSRKAFYGKTKAEAIKKYKSYLEDFSDAPVKSTRTVYEIAQLAVEARKEQVKTTTYNFYLYGVKRLSKDRIGNFQIQSTTQDDLQKYINGLKDTDSMSTIKRQRIVLGITFSYAEDHALIHNNPMKKVKLPNEANVVKEERQPVFLTTEERHQIEKEACRLNTKKLFRGKIGTSYYGINAQAITFILHTGLRIGELCALQWENVDMKLKTVAIKQNATLVSDPISGKTSSEITTPKRKSSFRKIPLDDYAFNIIKQLSDDVNGDFVFHTSSGGMLTRNNVLKTLKRMIERCEIDKDPTVHDLRHTYASELIRNGVDIKTVSEILGHKDIATTMNIYVHKNDDDLSVVRGALR